MRTSRIGGNSLMSEKLFVGLAAGAPSSTISGSTEKAGFSSIAGAVEAVLFGDAGVAAGADGEVAPAAAALTLGASRRGATGAFGVAGAGATELAPAFNPSIARTNS